MGPNILTTGSLLLGACWFATCPAKANPPLGYLRALGPAPMRFRVAPVPAPRLHLPIVAPVASPKSDHPVAPTPPEVEPATNSTSGAFELFPPIFAATSSPASEQPGPSPGAVNATGEPAGGFSNDLVPQAVLGYLLPLTTNVPAGKVVVPIFVPPPPPPSAASSHASYETR